MYAVRTPSSCTFSTPPPPLLFHSMHCIVVNLAQCIVVNLSLPYDLALPCWSVDVTVREKTLLCHFLIDSKVILSESAKEKSMLKEKSKEKEKSKRKKEKKREKALENEKNRPKVLVSTRISVDDKVIALLTTNH